MVGRQRRSVPRPNYAAMAGLVHEEIIIKDESISEEEIEVNFEDNSISYKKRKQSSMLNQQSEVNDKRATPISKLIFIVFIILKI